MFLTILAYVIGISFIGASLFYSKTYHEKEYRKEYGKEPLTTDITAGAGRFLTTLTFRIFAMTPWYVMKAFLFLFGVGIILGIWFQTHG